MLLGAPHTDHMSWGRSTADISDSDSEVEDAFNKELAGIQERTLLLGSRLVDPTIPLPTTPWKSKDHSLKVLTTASYVVLTIAVFEMILSIYLVPRSVDLMNTTACFLGLCGITSGLFSLTGLKGARIHSSRPWDAVEAFSSVNNMGVVLVAMTCVFSISLLCMDAQLQEFLELFWMDRYQNSHAYAGLDLTTAKSSMRSAIVTISTLTFVSGVAMGVCVYVAQDMVIQVRGSLISKQTCLVLSLIVGMCGSVLLGSSIYVGLHSPDRTRHSGSPNPLLTAVLPMSSLQDTLAEILGIGLFSCALIGPARIHLWSYDAHRASSHVRWPALVHSVSMCALGVFSFFISAFSFYVSVDTVDLAERHAHMLQRDNPVFEDDSVAQRALGLSMQMSMWGVATTLTALFSFALCGVAMQLDALLVQEELNRRMHLSTQLARGII